MDVTQLTRGTAVVGAGEPAIVAWCNPTISALPSRADAMKIGRDANLPKDPKVCSNVSDRDGMDRERDFYFGGNHERPQLIDNASFGPDALKVIGEAFDAAWTEIAGSFVDDPVVIEAARLQLANAIL